MPLTTAGAILGGSLIAGGSSALGSIISGIAGRSSTGANNATAWRIADDANRLQERLFYDQREHENYWNQKQFDEQRWYYNDLKNYNDPVSEMARYRAAGVNPYFALGNVEPGNVGSVSSPSPNSSLTPPSMHVAQTQAYDPTQAIMQGFSGIAGAVDSYFRNSQVAEETKNTAIRNLTQLGRDIAEREKNLASANLTKVERARAEKELQLLKDTYDDQVRSVGLQNDLLYNQGKNVSKDTEVKEQQRYGLEIANDISNRSKDFQIQRFKKEVDKLISDINLNWSLSAKAIQEKLESAARTSGIWQSNWHNKIFQNLIRQGQQIQNKVLRQELPDPDHPFSSGKYNLKREAIVSGLQGLSYGLGQGISSAAQRGVDNYMPLKYPSKSPQLHNQGFYTF